MLYTSIHKKNIAKVGCLITLSILSLVAKAQEPAAKQAPLTEVKNGVKINGVVVDGFGKPIPGVSVSVPAYSATISNNKGEFSLRVPYLSSTIVISGENYQKREFALRGQSQIQITMNDEGFTSAYKEVSLPGATFKSNSPYAVEVIDLESSHWEVPANQTAGGFLQGRASGLYSTRRSGNPNSEATLWIRGFNSLYASNKPLVVVDGMIYDNEDFTKELIGGSINSPLAGIDLKDIEDITVIKDGSSIYGTKGANGVILIRTTHPTSLTTRMDVGVYSGFNQTPEHMPLLNSEQYRGYLVQLLQSKGMSQAEVQSQPYMSAGLNLEERNTNWQKEVLKNSYNKNLYLKVTGGDNIAKYALSLGYQNNAGIIKSTDISKYNMRLNGDLNLTKKLTLQANLSFYYTQGNSRDQGIYNTTNPLYVGLVKAPFFTTNEIAEDGSRSPNLAGVDYFNLSNPSVLVGDKSVGSNRAYKFWGNLQFGYKVNKDLNLRSIVGLNFDKGRETFFLPERGVTRDTLNIAVATNRSGGEVNRLFSIYNDTYLNHIKSYQNKHNLDTRIGLRVQTNEAESDLAYGFNAPTDDFYSVGAGSPLLRQIGGTLGKWNWLNLYAAANYNYLNKYFLAVTATADASSRFGDDARHGAFGIGSEKFAFLPSMAAAWLISSEDFMKGSRFIDQLKLRASYGISGNDDIGNYTARTYYVSQNLLGIQGLIRGNIGNPQLQWERVKKVNLGLDFNAFKEKFNVSVDIFRNKTDNMIFIQDLNDFSGFDHIISNSAAMSTDGIDFSVSSRLISKANLKFDLGLNLSTYRNEVTALPVAEKVTSYYRANYITKVGQEANLFYGLKTSGIFATNEEAAVAGLKRKLENGTVASYTGGDVHFIDRDGNGFIDANDRTVIGNPNPDFVGMFSGMLTYKRFAFNTLFNFSVGNEVYNSTRNSLEMMSGYDNQTKVVLNRWRADGQQTSVPKATWGDPMGNAQFSDRWIEDGSYIRLRTASLSYTVPIQNKTIQSAKIYLSGDNLFTISNYLGYDPEFSSNASLFSQRVDTGMVPQFRTIQLGFKLGL